MNLPASVRRVIVGALLCAIMTFFCVRVKGDFEKFPFPTVFSVHASVWIFILFRI